MNARVFWGWCGTVTAALVVTAAATVTGEPPPVAPGSLPARLSQTGLYSDAATLRIDDGNRPFAPQYPLWTDGATKRRWIRLPAGTTIDARRVDAWDFPVGTRFWKEFSFGNHRVETRMLVKVSDTQWDFASYRWNSAQTDADLAPPEGIPAVAEVAPGKRHSIPSIDECRACHDSGRTEVLGFTALQLSDDRDPSAVHIEAEASATTIATLMRDGLLRGARPEWVSAPPRIPAASPRTRAALGYLSTNCGACHNTASTLAPLGLVLRQPAYGGGIDVVRPGFDQRTKWDRPGAAPETTRVVDRDTVEASALLVRMKSRRPASQMPPLGSVLVDHEAVDLIADWLTDEAATTDRAGSPIAR